MQITHNPKSRLPAAAAQLLLGVAGLAVITFVCFWLGFHIGRTAFAYLIVLALVSLLGSFSASVVLSFVAVACLNYFFVAPLFDFRIDDPEDIERIAVFLTTSLVVTAVTTRRKRGEQQLAESKARLEEAQRLAHVGWWERDLLTGKVTVSDEVARILGVRPVTRWLHLIHPDDRQKAADAADAAIIPGGPRYDLEYRVIRPDGTERIVHSKADATWDRSGRPLRQFGVLQDVTELRRTEEELRDSEARFRTFVDHATDAFFVLDENGVVLDVNRQACEDLGYRREELIGKHRRDFDAGVEGVNLRRMRQRIVAGEAVTFETRNRRKDGTLYPVEVRVSQFQQDGRRFLCLVRDITERKQAEETLRRNETYLAAAELLSKMGSWAWRPAENKITHWSQGRYRLFGFDPADGVPSLEAVLERIHPEDRAPWLENRSVVACGGESDFDFRIVLPDGGTKHVHAVGRPILNQSGEVVEVMGAAADITERKRTEDELRASEQRFRTFVDHATDGFFLLDEHQVVLDVNRQTCESLGYTRDEMIGMHPRDFDSGLDPASIARIGQRVTAGETVTFETLHRRKDGSVFPVEVRARQFQHGAHRFRLSLARDITERKHAETLLRQRERELRDILETIPAMTVTVLPDGSNVFLGKRFSEYSGVSEKDGQGSGWKACIHPDDLDLHVCTWRASLTSGSPIEIETRFRRSDGEYRWFLARAAPLRDEAGNVVKWYEVLTDIEDRKQAEQALRASQTKLEAAQRIAHVGWWERDFISGHVALSDEVCRIFGVEPLELPQWHERWLKLIHPEDRPRAAQAAAAALQPGGRRYDIEYRVVRPDGDVRIVHSQGDVTRDDAGRPLRQFGVLQDITELRRAEEELRASEQALRRSEAYLAEAQRLSHIGTLAFNMDGPVYWSEESYRIWGFDPRQGLPSRDAVLQLIHPDDRDRVNAEIAEAERHKRDFALEFRILFPDGAVKHIQAIGRPLLSAAGELTGMVATHVDVTERKRVQEQQERLRQLESELAHVNRMSMMGELAASLAHEILHPIATARNNARAGIRFLDRNPPNLEEVKEALACVVRDADRGKAIVDRIRDHIKKAPPQHDRFEINDAIDEVLAMVGSAIEKNRVSVRTELMQSLPAVQADRVQLQQVILNLVLNAVEAMSSAADGTRELSIRTEQDRAGDILVAVEDSGPGLDAEQLKRVFEPFYTTKNSGIGMGLSICQSIIGTHGGRLWAELKHSRGARFQFTVPAAEGDS